MQLLAWGRVSKAHQVLLAGKQLPKIKIGREQTTHALFPRRKEERDEERPGVLLSWKKHQE